jgi:hypothetical protein
MENLKYTYDQVNDWIKTADQKAMILGSFNVAGFIYQLLSIDNVLQSRWYVITLFALSVTLTFFALFLWLRIVYPRLDNKHKTSKIYFQHISNAYQYDFSLGVSEIQNLSDENYKKDLAAQIVVNSTIAKNKYRNIQTFIWVFVAQLITILVLIITIQVK